jgi:hypothetical protein
MLGGAFAHHHSTVEHRHNHAGVVLLTLLELAVAAASAAYVVHRASTQATAKTTHPAHCAVTSARSS